MEQKKKKCLKNQSKWCSVPQCKFMNGSSVHYFPADKKLRKKWIIACKIGEVPYTETIGVRATLQV